MIGLKLSPMAVMSFVVGYCRFGVRCSVVMGARCAMWILMLGILWCASSMAAGEDDAIKEEVKTLLETKRNGVKLSAALVLCLITYFVSTLKIGDVEEINKDDADEMEQAAEEGWTEAYSKDLPKAFAMRVRKWAGDLFSSKKGDVLAGTSGIGNVNEEGRRSAAQGLAAELDLSAFDKEKAIKDMSAQGLTCERILAMSQSIIVGKPVSMSACEDLKYGGDPALSKLSKDTRKAGKRTLQDMIKAKDLSRTAAFFTDLARAFAFSGQTVESSLISTWWSETAGCFSSAPEALHSYLEDYFEKYAGRGLPVALDNALLNRLRTSSMAGASKEEIKSINSKLSASEDENKKLKNRMKTMEDRLSSLKPPGAGPPGPGGRTKETPEEYKERRSKSKCHNCGEVGHFKWECPHPAKEEE